MIIKDFRTTVLSLPWADMPRFAAGFDLPRNILVLEVETGEGIVGMGYLHLLNLGLRTIDTCLHEMVKPAVLGRDATHIEGIWRDLYHRYHQVGRMGVLLFAMSALDVALWDALGKKAGLPLYRLWGASREEVPVYGSGVYRGLGGDGMIEKAKRYVKQGFKAVKMQVAWMHTPAQDVKNVRAMRDALGPDIDIMIDVNRGWSADTAIATARQFEDCNIYWLEEPVPVDDFPGYLRVARALSMRIVGGENHYTRWDLRPFFEQSGIPILQPDFMRGGLTEMRKIAAVADTWGIQLAPHLFPELMVHMLCSIPNGLTLEYMGWLDDLWVDAPKPEKSIMRPSQRPGHGLAFKPEVLKEFAVKK
jgi:L-alanine-DL-glutamate epimerase-like enolase superfamily enzyme